MVTGNEQEHDAHESGNGHDRRHGLPDTMRSFGGINPRPYQQGHRQGERNTINQFDRHRRVNPAVPPYEPRHEQQKGNEQHGQSQEGEEEGPQVGPRLHARRAEWARAAQRSHLCSWVRIQHRDTLELPALTLHPKCMRRYNLHGVTQHSSLPHHRVQQV
jgi:hypothetical protein